MKGHVGRGRGSLQAEGRGRGEGRERVVGLQAERSGEGGAQGGRR